MKKVSVNNVLAKDKYAKQRDEVNLSEAYLTGLFWNNPEQYDFYPEERLNRQTFLNPDWGFYFDLGREMHQAKISYFDDVSLSKFLIEDGMVKQYEKYGAYEKIEEVMEEVRGREENLEAYYQDVKKYRMLIDLHELFGDKVITKTAKYDYRRMNTQTLHTYWHDKVNKLALESDSNFEVQYLLEGLNEDIKEWDETPDIGLPFYNSRHMNGISTGWDYGNLYIYGGFGGSGKTTFTFNKVIMSCIEHAEPLLIIANEQGIKEFKKLLLVTAMGIIRDTMRRQRLNEGNFSEDEKKKLKNAVKWIEEFSKEQSKLIALVFMEDYIISNVKKIIRHFNARGYKSVIIDTGKPSDGGAEKARWEVFTEDFKELYKICRPNGGGLNLRMWINVQLADTALTRRFLDVDAFGESKKIKNEASVVYMGRNIWDDEYEGGDKEIKVVDYVEHNSDRIKKADPFKVEKLDKYTKIEFALKRYYKDKNGNKQPNQYYLLFTPKNRRGQDNKGGQRILVLKANFNNNTWEEIGWTDIVNDKNY